MTAAEFLSVAAAAWMLGTTRQARIIEVLSLVTAIVGSIVMARLHLQTVGRWTRVGYIVFWTLSMLVSICWILVAATGATHAA